MLDKKNLVQNSVLLTIIIESKQMLQKMFRKIFKYEKLYNRNNHWNFQVNFLSIKLNFNKINTLNFFKSTKKENQIKSMNIMSKLPTTSSVSIKDTKPKHFYHKSKMNQESLLRDQLLDKDSTNGKITILYKNNHLKYKILLRLLMVLDRIF